MFFGLNNCWFSQHMNSLVTRNDTIYGWIAELTTKPDGSFVKLGIDCFVK